MTNRLRRSDDGAMLIFALIIITTVALVTGAVLSHGWTNLSATVTLRGVAGTSYAGDAAAKVGLNNLRLGSDAPGWTDPTFPGPWADWVFTKSSDGTGCFGADGTAPDNTLELNGFYPAAGDQTAATSARVECSAVPGTGVFAPGKGVGVDDPQPTDPFARALTTIGTSGSLQGMLLKPLGTGNTAAMPIRGGIASKSSITVDNGALVTDGYVKAEGACSGQIISNPPKQCNAAGSVPVPATPPAPLTSVPAYRNPAAQGCSFQPGFYNNAAALTAAVNACGTATFASGKYYFDFVDEEHSGQNVWKIDTTVIGGELLGGSIPGRCKSPILNDPVQGAQFVFGGTSRVALGDNAHVEICGPSNAGDPPMTIYQQGSGTAEAPVSLTNRVAATVTEKSGSGGGDKWTTSVRTPVAATPQAALAAADGSNLAYTIAGNNDDVGLDLSDFADLSSIPAGSDITSAQVRVKYTKTSARSLAVTLVGQTPASVPISAPDGSGFGTADLAAQLRTALQSGAFTGGAPTLQLRLMDAAKNDTLTIDAVQLSVTYTPPALRAAQDVVLIGLIAGSNFAGEFVVQGAVWAPHGYIALDPGSNNQALVSFRWGLVALGVDFKAQPSQEFGYPLVSIPAPGSGSLGPKVTAVDLKVYVCVQQATCATGGTHVLTVRALITDPPYGASGAPVPGKRQIKVVSWSEQK